MAGGKETPRQKMIGMMYLVLTALLAMNVSKDILNGFIVVNESLERTNYNLSQNTKRLYDALEKSSATNLAAQPFVPKAQEVIKITSEAYNYIDLLKKEIVQITEEKGSYKDSISRDQNLDKGWSMWYLDKKDNYDTPTNFLIGDNETSPKDGPNTAKELRQKLIAVHDKLLALFKSMQDPKNSETNLAPGDYEAILKKIESITPHDPDHLVDGVKETWETENFYHLPLAAVITNLSKIQSDVKNVESECILQISSAPGKLAFTANKLSAKVIAPSSYVQSGDKYVADVFLAASSDDFKNPDIISIFRGAKYDTITKTCTGCEGKDNLLPIDAKGFGRFETGTSGTGKQNWGGVIRYKNKKGAFEYYPFEESYDVSPPSVSVQADEMNVFYIGVENPITVNAAGIPPGELIVTAKGGGITLAPKGNSKWIVKATTPCGKGQEAEIVVNGKPRPDGTKPKGGSMKFRVKRIPPPYPMLAGKKSGDKISKIDLSGAGFLIAKLDNFDFNAPFKVISWEFSGVIAGQPKACTGNGSSLSEECKGYLKKAGTGSRLFFDVKAQGPDGVVQTLPTLGLKVQ